MGTEANRNRLHSAILLPKRLGTEPRIPETSGIQQPVDQSFGHSQTSDKDSFDISLPSDVFQPYSFLPVSKLR